MTKEQEMRRNVGGATREAQHMAAARQSKLDAAWRHANRAGLAIERVCDRSLSSSQTVRETLEELEERADELLAAIERARGIV